MLLGAVRMDERKGLMGRERDQFPVGMRVLAVDDDPVCLKVLETLLRRCHYHVTSTNQAITALKLLRENRDMFDLVISDVHMPDMDGFKLLELVGLEMDLPVIMLSVNGETKSVMKGITHGACDYLLKPVRIEELRNVWQHVVRRKFTSRERRNLDLPKEYNNPPIGDTDHAPNQFACGSSDQNGRISKKRKDLHSDDDEDEGDDNDFQENDEPSAAKKPRVVWSVELHRKFVAAVNQLGIDKAVPKRILELMNVEKLTRENVASHLQKYRLYLKRLSAVASQQASIVAAFGGRDPSFLHMGAFEGIQSYQPFVPSSALSSFSPHGLLSATSGTAFGLQELAPSNAIQACTSNIGTLSHCLEENQQANLAQGLIASHGQPQLQQKWIHQENNDISTVFSGSGIESTLCSLQRVGGSSFPPQELLECTQMKDGAAPSIRMSLAGSGFLERTLGVSTNLQDTSISLQGALAMDNEFCADNLPLHTSFDGSVTAKIDTSLAASQQEIGQKRKFSVNMLVYPSENLGVAKRSKCEASSSGSTIMLPPHAERHSNYFQFGGTSSSTSPRMDDRKQDHTHNSKVIWSSIPSSQLPSDTLVASLDNRSFNHNVGPSLTDQTIASVPSVPQMKFDTLTSEDKLKQRNIYDLAKLQGGFNSSSCNFDGLLNSIIKVENDDIPFMDNDLGCDLFPLGACI